MIIFCGKHIALSGYSVFPGVCRNTDFKDAYRGVWLVGPCYPAEIRNRERGHLSKMSVGVLGVLVGMYMALLTFGM